MKKIRFYGWVMALSLLWVLPALASTTSQTFTAQGRTVLFNNGSPTVPGLQQAVDKFKSAVQADPNNREARFFSAVSGILLSATQNSGKTVITTLADLAKSFGVNRNTNISLLSSPYDKPPMLSDQYNPPTTIPGGSQLQTFLAGPFLDLLDASLADLSVINNQESDASPFKLTLTASELNYPTPVEVDYGDVLLIEAGLRAMKSFILITNAYNIDYSLRDMIVLGNAGILQIERDLAGNDKYPDLMKLKSNGTGAAELTKARSALIKSIDDSRAAMAFIKTKRDAQGDYLFTFADQSEMDNAQLNIDGMTEIENSLKENRPAILSRTESFDLVLSNGDTPKFYVKTNVDGEVADAHDISFSGSIDGTYLYYIDHSSFVKTTTSLQIKVDGGANEWDQNNQIDQWCNISYTVNAVLSGDTIKSGSVAVTDSCKGNSSFSITSSSVTSTDSAIDLNRIFGNTEKSPLNIRSYMPNFDARGTIINDDSLPVPAFSGIFPGTSYQNFVSLVSPVPSKTIAVDGDDTDWQDINNIVNTSNFNFQPPPPDYVKIKNVKLSRDSKYIYVMVQIAAVDTTEPLTVYATFSYGNQGQYLSAELSYDGNGTTTCTVGDVNGTLSTDTNNGKLDKVAELRLPIDKISDYSNAWLGVSTSSSSGQNSYDSFSAHILLLPAPKDTGTVTCAANNGHGQIFIVAYDGPEMIRKAFLGSAIIKSPGNFTIPLFARTANTYFYGWWDADDNGILSPGDYTGSIGPLNTTTQTVALNLNKRVMVDFDFTKVTVPSSPQAGGSLSFSAANGDTDGKIISYGWNFGDNTTATGAEVNHTYQQAGDYQLTLKIKTKSGETGSRSTIIHIAAAAYKIDGAISGLASGKSITLYAYSASTGSYGFQVINGGSSSLLNYSITNLSPAPDYTLFINSSDYPGGYYGGKGGLTNASQAASIDLSTSDKQNVNFTLPSAKTLTVQLNNVKAGDQIEVRAWSQSLGLMSEQTVTANGTSVTATMDNLKDGGNYVVYIRPIAGNAYRDGYYQGENLQPGSLSQALILSMTADTAINISMGNGYKITGTIKGLAAGEIATVSAWSPGYRNGNAALFTGTGKDILYTISGLPSRPDYLIAIKVLGGGGGYYNGAGLPLTTYQNALPVALTADVGGIDLALPQGHSISGNITGTGGGDYAVVYAWSPSTGNYASTGITLPGAYSFTNLPPASDYKVGVYARNYLNPTPLIVDISQNQNDQVNQNFTLTTGGGIIGIITVPSKTANLRVMACSAAHDTCTSLNLRAPQAGGDVNYFLSGLPAANDLILSLHLSNTVYFYDSSNGSSYLTSDPSQAMDEALTLDPGQVLTGINMDLSSLQTFSMTGTVKGLADKDIAVVITAWNNQGGRGSVVRNGNGTYAIPGLPAGNYYLMATAVGYSNMFYNGTSWGIGLGKAKLFSVTADTNINDLTLNKGYTVSGTLTGPDGKPLAGVYISAWDADQKFGSGTVSLADGTFKISGLPAGTYSLEVHCQAGDSVVTINLSADITQNITVIKDAGVISGKVTGSGRNNAIIFVYDYQDHYVAAVVPSVDASGNYTYKIDNLPATGTYSIKVYTDGNYNTMEWTGSVTLSSTAASQVLNIGL